MGNNPSKMGRLYGVGVGPGDPELLTMRAYRILSTVPVVFVPQKDDESGSFARSIIAGVVQAPSQRVVGLVLPMVKDRARLAACREQAADIIWQQLENCRDCAFVNVGDPLLYGTFAHVLKALKQGHPEIEVEVIPGVSSISAAAARTITPLASNDERVAIISAADDEEFIRNTLNTFDTVAFLKVNKLSDSIFDILEELDLTEKCVYVRRCTTPDEEIVRQIAKLRGRSLDYFSLLLVRR